MVENPGGCSLPCLHGCGDARTTQAVGGRCHHRWVGREELLGHNQKDTSLKAVEGVAWKITKCSQVCPTSHLEGYRIHILYR